MMTVSVAFLIFQSGASETAFHYFEGGMYWYIGGDLIVSTTIMGSGGNQFLDEVPISELLDSLKIGTEQADGSRGFIDSYVFESENIHELTFNPKNV